MTNLNYEDFKILSRIADRALTIAKKYQERMPKKLDLVMDLELAHSKNPLRLEALEHADDFNIIHDVFGIIRHLDRDTGNLKNCFSPRYSA